MSHKLISHSPDLRRLRDEGYEIEVIRGHLRVHVPYVNATSQVERGVLVTPLGDLAGDKTSAPSDHVIFFKGSFPCDRHGCPLKGIDAGSGTRLLAEGVEVDHRFSNKPTGGYPDYYEKITSYVRIISSPAEAVDPNIKVKTFKVIESPQPESVFHYWDTNSSRAEIDAISARLESSAIAIVGLGGSGSYVLDFIAKTPVREIHLFDGDQLLSHNAFRAPGAAPLEILREQPKKVSYFHTVYSKLHKHVVVHDYYVTAEEAPELSVFTFVFVCIDDAVTKKPIIDHLLTSGTPFIDVGMGVYAVDGRLTGSVRTSTFTPAKNDHLGRRISFAEADEQVYDKNVQIAELNALNAALAVIKWKKLLGFYHDLGNEHHSVFEINVNKITNDETQA